MGLNVDRYWNLMCFTPPNWVTQQRSLTAVCLWTCDVADKRCRWYAMSAARVVGQERKRAVGVTTKNSCTFILTGQISPPVNIKPLERVFKLTFLSISLFLLHFPLYRWALSAHFRIGKGKRWIFPKFWKVCRFCLIRAQIHNLDW